MTSPAPESSTPKCTHDAGGMYDGPTNIWCAEGCGTLLECVCLQKQYCLVHPSLSRTRGLSKSPAPASCSEVVERLATDIRARYQPQTDVFMDDLEEIIAPRLHEWREQIRRGQDP